MTNRSALKGNRGLYRLFLHVPDPVKRGRIEALCGNRGISCSPLSGADVNTRVLELLSREMTGGAGKTAAAASAAPPLYVLPELLLFQGIPDREVHRFLEAYREAGIDRIALKAVVTPHNLTWTLYELAEHLREEETAFRNKEDVT